MYAALMVDGVPRGITAEPACNRFTVDIQCKQAKRRGTEAGGALDAGVAATVIRHKA